MSIIREEHNIFEIRFSTKVLTNFMHTQSDEQSTVGATIVVHLKQLNICIRDSAFTSDLEEDRAWIYK
jgi:hypothetical protein